MRKHEFGPEHLQSDLERETFWSALNAVAQDLSTAELFVLCLLYTHGFGPKKYVSKKHFTEMVFGTHGISPDFLTVPIQTLKRAVMLRTRVVAYELLPSGKIVAKALRVTRPQSTQFAHDADGVVRRAELVELAMPTLEFLAAGVRCVVAQGLSVRSQMRIVGPYTYETLGEAQRGIHAFAPEAGFPADKDEFAENLISGGIGFWNDGKFYFCVPERGTNV